MVEVNESRVNPVIETGISIPKYRSNFNEANSLINKALDSLEEDHIEELNEISSVILDAVKKYEREIIIQYRISCYVRRKLMDEGYIIDFITPSYSPAYYIIRWV